MTRYSIAFREGTLAAIDAGESITSVARARGVHPDTIDNWLRLRARTGFLAPKQLASLTDAHREVLRSLVEANPAAQQQQLADQLAAACGAHVSQATIGKELRKLGFGRVKAPKPRRLSPEVASGRPGGYRTPASASRRRYPSDLSDAQWELLAPLVPAPKPGGRPTLHPRRAIVEAILYVTRTGCQWRALPHDFPPWSTVYQLFREWRDNGVWEAANAALRERSRMVAGRAAIPSAAIIDSQVARTTEKGGSVGSMGASG